VAKHNSVAIAIPRLIGPNLFMASSLAAHQAGRLWYLSAADVIRFEPGARGDACGGGDGHNLGRVDREATDFGQCVAKVSPVFWRLIT
jgi:hypothetical protein